LRKLFFSDEKGGVLQFFPARKPTWTDPPLDQGFCRFY
jgi:hypothetical protein